MPATPGPALPARLHRARIAALGQLYRLHEAEVEAVADWPALAARMGLRWPRGAVGIDVGAALGVYTGLIRRFCRVTLAVEPHPRQAAQLRAAGWPDVVIVEAAASDRDGEGRLAGSDPARAYQPLGRLAAGGDGFPVRTVRLDTVLAEQGAAPGRDALFVKLDAEGHEAAILSGLGDWLSEDVALLMEIEPHLNPAWRDLVAGLAARGLFPYRFGHGRLAPADLEALFARQAERFPEGPGRFGRLKGHANTFFFLRAG